MIYDNILAVNAIQNELDYQIAKGCGDSFTAEFFRDELGRKKFYDYDYDLANLLKPQQDALIALKDHNWIESTESRMWVLSFN